MTVASLDEEIVLKAPLTFFKRVAADLSSEYDPDARATIPGFFSAGVRLAYTPGTRVVSPSGPGVMGYKSLSPNMTYAPTTPARLRGWRHGGERWLVLRAPPYAKVRYGQDEDENEIICASEVDVLGEIKVDFAPGI